MTQNQQSQSRIEKYICLLSALHAGTLANTWHLLSDSDVPWPSRTFYLHTFILIIKYEVKEFSEEGGGKWHHFDLCVKNTNEPTLYEEQYYHDSNKGNCQAGKMDSSTLFSCLPGPFGGRAQTLLHKLVSINALFSFLASQKQVSYHSERLK